MTESLVISGHAADIMLRLKIDPNLVVLGFCCKSLYVDSLSDDIIVTSGRAIIGMFLKHQSLLLPPQTQHFSDKFK